MPINVKHLIFTKRGQLSSKTDRTDRETKYAISIPLRIILTKSKINVHYVHKGCQIIVT